MGYALAEVTPESLLEFANEEYDYIKWDERSLRKGDDFLALWGWNEDGTYEVALALYYERSEEEVEKRLRFIYKDSEITEEVKKFHKSGWNLKFINEVEGPVIQPSKTFLITRPQLTLDAKRKLKKAEEFSNIMGKILKRK